MPWPRWIQSTLPGTQSAHSMPQPTSTQLALYPSQTPPQTEPILAFPHTFVSVCLPSTTHSLPPLPLSGLPWCLRWLRICLQCGRPGFSPWVEKIPWRKERVPTPVFWPGEFHGQRSLAGYKSMGSPRVRHNWETFTSLLLLPPSCFCGSQASNLRSPCHCYLYSPLARWVPLPPPLTPPTRFIPFMWYLHSLPWILCEIILSYSPLQHI